LNDWIEDVILLGWHELKAADQFAMAQEFLDQANQLEKFGYICQLGHNRQMRPDWNMILTAGLVAIKPKKSLESKGSPSFSSKVCGRPSKRIGLFRTNLLILINCRSQGLAITFIAISGGTK
jgi:hypothetical protein